MKVVNILGTTYTIEIDDSLEKTEMDGLCKVYDKEIKIRNASAMLCDDDSPEIKEKRFNEVLRHEIIHAFFSEAGLDEYGDNEQLVNWIAVQFPKIQKVFEKIGCI